tara:strand:+ start:1192 stop:1638 length:447 start_codon:yes stop_codon:yes gene_type:complete
MKKILLIILFSFLFLDNNVIAKDKFLSLKNSKVNVRYGPSLDSPVKYIYKKINLPVKLIDKTKLFRKIIDLKNNSGWIHWTQLKESNSIITLENKILFKKPSSFSKPLAKIEEGRLLVLKKCQKNWCKIKTEEYSGWIKTNNIWGNTN